MFGTDNYSYIRDGVKTGQVYYYGDDYYLVSPKYYKKHIEPILKSIDEAESEYANQDGGPWDNFSDLDNVEYEDETKRESDADYNARLQERINEMMKTRSASSDDLNTDIAKAYKEFCKTWVSEYELKNSYNISVVWNWPSNQIYLIKGIDSKYIIDNAPDKFENRKIYSGSGVQYQYLDKFIYNNDSYIENQFYFNRDDLKNVGVIK